MFTHTTNKLPKQTFEFTLHIPWTDIEAEYQKSFDALLKEFTYEGFRKGKVPKEIAQKHMSKDEVYQHLIRSMLPAMYEEVLKKEGVQPIISPKIELIKAKENEDWEVKITTAERPKIDLGNYKEEVKKAKADAKKADIWVPGQDPKKDEEHEEKQKQAGFQASLNALLKEVKIEVSELILEEELNNRLSRLLDDIQKIGLTAEAYLKSKNTNLDELKAQLQKDIEETYKLEFILQEIADKENVNIDESEIAKLFGNIKDEKERQAAQQNAYYYASVMRKQKTLEYINNL